LPIAAVLVELIGGPKAVVEIDLELVAVKIASQTAEALGRSIQADDGTEKPWKIYAPNRSGGFAPLPASGTLEAAARAIKKKVDAGKETGFAGPGEHEGKSYSFRIRLFVPTAPPPIQEPETPTVSDDEVIDLTNLDGDDSLESVRRNPKRARTRKKRKTAGGADDAGKSGSIRKARKRGRDPTATGEIKRRRRRRKSVADESVAEGSLADGSLADESVADGSVADGSVADGSVADGSVADGSVADGSVADGSVADGSVADGSVADGSVADGSVVDEPVADEPVADEAVADEAVADEAVGESASTIRQDRPEESEEEQAAAAEPEQAAAVEPEQAAAAEPEQAVAAEPEQAAAAEPEQAAAVEPEQAAAAEPEQAAAAEPEQAAAAEPEQAAAAEPEQAATAEPEQAAAVEPEQAAAAEPEQAAAAEPEQQPPAEAGPADEGAADGGAEDVVQEHVPTERAEVVEDPESAATLRAEAADDEEGEAEQSVEAEPEADPGRVDTTRRVVTTTPPDVKAPERGDVAVTRPFAPQLSEDSMGLIPRARSTGGGREARKRKAKRNNILLGIGLLVSLAVFGGLAFSLLQLLKGTPSPAETTTETAKPAARPAPARGSDSVQIAAFAGGGNQANDAVALSVLRFNGLGVQSPADLATSDHLATLAELNAGLADLCQTQHRWDACLARSRVVLAGHRACETAQCPTGSAVATLSEAIASARRARNELRAIADQGAQRAALNRLAVHAVRLAGTDWASLQTGAPKLADLAMRVCAKPRYQSQPDCKDAGKAGPAADAN
jgi:hypothetical protein